MSASVRLLPSSMFCSAARGSVVDRAAVLQVAKPRVEQGLELLGDPQPVVARPRARPAGRAAAAQLRVAPPQLLAQRGPAARDLPDPPQHEQDHQRRRAGTSEPAAVSQTSTATDEQRSSTRRRPAASAGRSRARRGTRRRTPAAAPPRTAPGGRRGGRARPSRPSPPRPRAAAPAATTAPAASRRGTAAAAATSCGVDAHLGVAAVMFMTPTARAASPSRTRGEQERRDARRARRTSSRGAPRRRADSAAAATPDAPRRHADQRRDRDDLQSCRRVLDEDKHLEPRARRRARPTTATAEPAVRRRRRARRPAAGPRRSAPPSRRPARARPSRPWITSVTASMLRRRHRTGRVAAAKTGTMSHECESTRTSGSTAVMFSTMSTTPRAVRTAASATSPLRTPSNIGFSFARRNGCQER